MVQGEYEISLQALLEQDISSYEYYNTLSDDLKKRIEKEDIGSFEEIQKFVEKHKSYTD